jgi:hypothetical protein
MERPSAEKWLPIGGWVGFYEISDLGRVRSLTRLIQRKDGTETRHRGRILRPSRNLDGRIVVTLQRQISGTAYRRKPLLHRLIAKAFIPNPENKPEVNHKDGNCAHNWSANLEWATAEENKQHAVENGLNDGNPVRIIVRCIELGITTLGIVQMSSEMRAIGRASTPSALSHHLRERSVSHVGLRFRYVEADELPGMSSRDFLDRLGIP